MIKSKTTLRIVGVYEEIRIITLPPQSCKGTRKTENGLVADVGGQDGPAATAAKAWRGAGTAQCGEGDEVELKRPLGGQQQLAEAASPLEGGYGAAAQRAAPPAARMPA
jgi:hypothetical protein